MTTQYHDPAGLDALVSLYIDLVNRAISENYDNFYGRIAKRWARISAELPLAVGVYQDDANRPYRWYTVTFSGGRLTLMQIGRHPHARMSVRVKDAHIVRVVQDPDRYVERPLLRNLDWLKARLGLS